MSKEVDAFEQELAILGDNDERRDKLQEFLTRQLEYNQRLRATEAPAVWQDRHANIVRAIDTYSAAAIDLTAGETPVSLTAQLERFKAERAQLLEQVLRCYAAAPNCGVTSA
jgi:hypothetical protein